MAEIIVAALYRFVRLEDPAALRSPLLGVMRGQGVRGTVLLAREGINGTIAGPRRGIDAVLAWLREDPRLSALTHKESACDRMPFHRTKVRLKKEIVTMGVEGIDPNDAVGTYVKPADWNRVIADPDVTLIDTRNDYEVELGSFVGAIDPKTQTFRDFPEYAREHLDPARHKKVAMFCTGGIRCEKATALLVRMGFEQVLHLEGGVLKYLEQVPAEQSKWRGECFVFDERVTVGQGLTPGDHVLCHACGTRRTARARAASGASTRSMRTAGHASPSDRSRSNSPWHAGRRTSATKRGGTISGAAPPCLVHALKVTKHEQRPIAAFTGAFVATAVLPGV